MNIYTFPHSRAYNPSAPTVEIELRRARRSDSYIKLNALVDSGSDGTLIPFEHLRRINARYAGQTRVRGLLGERRMIDSYWVSVRLGAIELPALTVVAVQDLEDALIGRDILNQLIVTMNGHAQVTEVMG